MNVWMCRNGNRIAKAQLGLNLVENAKNNKGFYSYEHRHVRVGPEEATKVVRGLKHLSSMRTG